MSLTVTQGCAGRLCSLHQGAAVACRGKGPSFLQSWEMGREGCRDLRRPSVLVPRLHARSRAPSLLALESPAAACRFPAVSQPGILVCL